MYTSDMWSFERTADFFSQISFINKKNHMMRTHTSILGFRGYKQKI